MPKGVVLSVYIYAKPRTTKFFFSFQADKHTPYILRSILGYAHIHLVLLLVRGEIENHPDWSYIYISFTAGALDSLAHAHSAAILLRAICSVRCAQGLLLRFALMHIWAGNTAHAPGSCLCEAFPRSIRSWRRPYSKSRYL